jgi:thiol-disulfide isomerase/thioredoxin
MKAWTSTVVMLVVAVFGYSALLQTSAGGDSKESKQAVIELKDVKLDDLKAAIKAQQGKVVVIDFWATWCPPCVKEFPNLVEIHQKFPASEVVCMSLTFDKAKSKDKALKFLKDKKATFANYFFDEPMKVAQEHWNFSAIPVVAVYDRTGKLARTFTNADPDKQFEYKTDVIPFVEKLLKK